jgi:type VI secretion system secreted protein VgrG
MSVYGAALLICLGLVDAKCVRAAAAATSHPLFGKAAFDRDRQVLLARDNRRAFPLLSDNFEVVGPSGTPFNCIAHSLGLHDRWINPETGPPSDPLGPMDRMYASQGYLRQSGMDLRQLPGRQKVVVYAKIRGGRISSVTHAAVQEKDGTWTSKLGKLALIRHLTPNALRGPEYGIPVAVYERPVATARSVVRAPDGGTPNR